MISVSNVGGSGYVGGELLRLMLLHPDSTIQQVTSARLAGKPVTGPHPHLRGVTDLVFSSLTMPTNCDVLILALPHGSAAAPIDDIRLRRIAQPQADCLHPLFM
jgi:N-acetyl-gamma-glutamyl-phosphate/LysW-gamma-L-alpha-aminoadipyl-6-phosphate reductase